jgi:c-di-GMP-binding flagellar brake protein YcgR
MCKVDNFDSIIDDKRKFKRINRILQLQYRNLRKSGELPKETVTRNISEGGVCFNSDEFLSLACRMVVEINIPTVPKPIKAISKIAWIRKLPTSEHYEMGNQFLDMTREDKALISEFINNSEDARI